MKKLVVLLAALSMSGCSSIEIASGYIVDEYCKTSQPTRISVRALVNAGASPHDVKIVCEGDAELFIDSQ